MIPWHHRRVQVATWNLWWKFGPWEARQEPIAAELADLDPDVCCLQEVWADEGGDQALVLAERLGRHVARSAGPDQVAHRFGNAILSRWPISESFTLALPDLDGRPGHRSALFCRIDVPEAHHPWWVVSTHLEWRYTGSRLREMQLQAVVDEAARVRRLDTDTVIVLGGDFNAVAESDEIRRLTGLAEPYDEELVFTDTWAAVGAGPGDTWTRDNPHSENAQWPRRRLDAVFVSWPRPKPIGNPLRARVFGTVPRSTGLVSGESNQVVPSDHYGVAVELDRRRPSDLEPTP